MVRIDTSLYNNNNSNTNSNKMDSTNNSNGGGNGDSFFNLSKPLKSNFLFQLAQNIDLKSSTFTKSLNDFNNSTATDHSFSFLQPLESQRLKTTQKHKYTQRTQPYSLTKPTTSSSQQQATSSNNNALIARLTSISSNFKSMFVRPKHTKVMDISMFTKSKQQQQQQQSTNETKKPGSLNNSDQENETCNDYMFKLIRNDDQSMISGGSGSGKSSSSIEIRSSKQQQQQQPSSRFNNTSSYLAQRIKKLTNEYDETTFMSTPTPKQQQQRYSPSINQSYDERDLSQNNKTLTNQSLLDQHSGGAMSKWACMVCLSKHLSDVKICPLCGSAKPPPGSVVSFASSNSGCGGGGDRTSGVGDSSLFLKPKQATKTSSLLGTSTLSVNNTSGFTKSSLLQQQQHQQQQQQVHKPAVKMWTCTFCNYANDSLKVVCMNCRSSKSEIRINLNEQSTQVKRKSNSLLANIESASTSSSNSSCNSSICGSSISAILKQQQQQQQLNNNNNNDLDQQQQLPKRFKTNASQASVCPTCHHKVADSTSSTATTTQLSNNQAYKDPILLDSITPTKPAALFSINNNNNNATNGLNFGVNKEAPSSSSVLGSTSTTTKTTNENSTPLSTLFKSTNKWSCSTCLASNEPERIKCACCDTPKPTSTTTTTSTTTPLTGITFGSTKTSTENTFNNQTTLPSTAASSTTTTTAAPLNTLFKSTNKWSCKTCLAQNESDRTKCACCETPKDSTSSTATTTTPLTGIKFGSTTTSTTNNLTSSVSTSAPLSTLFKGTNKWSCSTCLASNEPERTKCACCETPKDPNDKSAASSSSSAFGGSVLPKSNTFGSSSSSSASSNPLFSFGTQSASTTSTSGLFPTQPLKVSNDSGPIKFGSSGFTLPSSTSAPSTTSNEPSKPSFGLNFGSQPTPTITSKPALATIPTIILGDNNPSESTNKTATGLSFSPFQQSPNKPQQQQQQTPQFGSTSTLFAQSQTSSNNTKTFEAPTIKFGSSALSTQQQQQQPSSNTFGRGGLFGSTSTNNNTIAQTSDNQNKPPLFAYGSSSNLQQQQQQDKPSTTTTNSLFPSTQPTTTPSLFGGSTTTSNNSTQPLAFGSSLATPSNIFGSSSSTTTNSSSQFQFASNNTGTATTTTTPAPSTGIFGSHTGSSSNIFGLNNTTAPSTTTTTTNTGIFGSSSTTTSSSSFGFGSSKPAAATTTTPSTSATNNTPFGSFGNSSSSNTLFGSANNSTNGTTTNPVSIFGSSSTTNTPLFSSNQQSSTTPSTNSFTFGASSTTQTNAFGSAASTTASSSPFLFGATTSATTDNNLSSNPNKRHSDEKLGNDASASKQAFSFDPAQTNFNFTTTTPANTAGPFQFSAGGPIHDSISSGTTPRRPYKAATRRMGSSRR